MNGLIKIIKTIIMKKQYQIVQIIDKDIMFDGNYDSDYKPYSQNTSIIYILDYVEPFNTLEEAESKLAEIICTNENYTIITIYTKIK